MWENFWAVVIQNFYKKFVKCERDKQEKTKIRILRNHKTKIIEIPSPIDPLYRIPYDEKYHFRLVEWNNNKAAIWHFNIKSLIEWLNISKDWINPMTNCVFQNKSVIKIIDYANKNHLQKKLKLRANFNVIEKKEVKSVPQVTGEVYLDLLVKSIDENNESDCFNILNNNYDKIESDYFKIDNNIDKSITINDDLITPIGVIHYAIMKNNKDILHHLLYYGCNINKTCGKGKYTAMHLAAIMNRVEMGKLLKMYGSDIMLECNYKGSDSTIFDICDDLGHKEFVMMILSS